MMPENALNGGDENLTERSLAKKNDRLH